MALTVEQAFREFEAKIALTDSQRDKMTSRASRAKELLETSFASDCSAPLRTTILMGSGARNTIIRPLDDIDVLVVFDNKDSVFDQYRHDSQAFLYWVRKRIDVRTEVQKVGARGQAVRLFYKDGLHVDIAPVFSWSQGGYALPAGDGSWLTTCPAKQQQWANDREATLSDQFKRRVRILKRWNNEHSKRLGSWHLEVMVGTAFKTMSPNHRLGVQKFFEWADGYLHVQDPDGHGRDLGAGLLASQESDIKVSFATNYKRASAAVEAEDAGDPSEAIHLWRVVLGDDFPSNG